MSTITQISSLKSCRSVLIFSFCQRTDAAPSRTGSNWESERDDNHTRIDRKPSSRHSSTLDDDYNCWLAVPGVRQRDGKCAVRCCAARLSAEVTAVRQIVLWLIIVLQWKCSLKPTDWRSPSLSVVCCLHLRPTLNVACVIFWYPLSVCLFFLDSPPNIPPFPL